MKILVLDIAASKTGALSVLKDFYGYVREHPCEGSDGTSSSIVKDKSILPSAVEPPADAPGLSGEDAAEAAKIRCRKRQSKKNYLVSHKDPGEPVYWTFVTGASGILESVPEKNIGVTVRDDVKASSKARLIFELFTGGKWVNSLHPDIVFSLENMLPRGISPDIRQVLYIHQPVGFQHEKRFSLFNKTEREQALYQRFYHPLIISSAKRADSCVVQTEWMKRALLREIGEGRDKVYRIPPDIPDLSEYVHAGCFDRMSFIYPASDLPYKNHAVIEEARKILERDGLKPEILYTKDKVLPREEIFAGYNRSTLLFPSYLETYGMPLGEAQQFGNPIIAADTEFAREVLEGYENAHFFGAFNAPELASYMRRVMEGEIIPVSPRRREGGHSSYADLVDIILPGAGADTL